MAFRRVLFLICLSPILTLMSVCAGKDSTCTLRVRNPNNNTIPNQCTFWNVHSGQCGWNSLKKRKYIYNCIYLFCEQLSVPSSPVWQVEWIYHRLRLNTKINILNPHLKKVYTVLKPGTWAGIINEHIWKAVKIPCAFVFKKSQGLSISHK